MYSNAIRISDIPWALMELGHTVETAEIYFEFTLREKEKEEELLGILSRTEYDFVITYNYLSQVSDVCERAGIRYASWTYDSPDLLLFTPSVKNKCNRIFLFDAKQVEQVKGAGGSHVYHLPLAANVSRMDRIVATPEEEKQFGADISFVGSLYDSNPYRDVQAGLPDSVQEFYETLFQEQLGRYKNRNLMHATPQWVQEYWNGVYGEENLTHQLKMEDNLFYSQYFITHELASRERREALVRLARQGHQVQLYTHAADVAMEGVRVRPAVRYEDEMIKVFFSSRINLNLTIPSIETGIPLRVYDILASGGFLLCNWQEELAQQFTPGEDLIVFEDLDDLCRKAEYYLTHERERLSIAIQGWKTVHDCHTYLLRMQELVEKTMDR
ncbi:MAG: DUF3880 domain-containing protein [Lachnospiraceae bacterium]|nr:DUF3880 domain-containing protein [Lachnospiraceae bacterium]